MKFAANQVTLEKPAERKYSAAEWLAIKVLNIDSPDFLDPAKILLPHGTRDISYSTVSSLTSIRIPLMAGIARDFAISIGGVTPKTEDTLRLVVLNAALIRLVDNIIDQPSVSNLQKRQTLRGIFQILTNGVNTYPRIDFGTPQQNAENLAADIHSLLKKQPSNAICSVLGNFEKLIEVELYAQRHTTAKARQQLGEQTFITIFSPLLPSFEAAYSKKAAAIFTKLFGLAQVLSDFKDRKEDCKNEIKTFINDPNSSAREIASTISSTMLELFKSWVDLKPGLRIDTLACLSRFFLASVVCWRSKYDKSKSAKPADLSKKKEEAIKPLL